MNALTKEFTESVEKQFDKLSADVKDALAKAGVAKSIAEDMQQQIDRRGGGEDGAGESWGAQFAEADAVKRMAEDRSQPRRYRMEMKATITTAADSGGSVGAGPYRDGVVALPTRTVRVRQLLPTVRISSGSVEYPKQTTRTNNAAMVAEGALKPESVLGWEMETLTPKVIAHWVPASVQILSDATQLRDTIDTELRYGLSLKEDQQLLTGSGTGENLEGLVTNATAYSAPFDPTGTETMIDQLALAILQTTLADFQPTGIVLHPSDWMRIRLLKDADGKYLLGDPGANVAPVLFGLPVVPTTGMTIDKFLVGDFQRAATLYDRWEPRVEVSTEHADFFVRNLVAIRAEQRLALGVKNGLALTYGDFGNAA